MQLVTVLQWIYLVNFVFFIMHETDAAYWKEWRMFGKAGASLSDEKGLTIFILAHVPICITLIYGLLSLDISAGKIISLGFSWFLIGHFIMHMLARKQGREEFAWPISYFIQFSLLVLSIVQVILTVNILI